MLTRKAACVEVGILTMPSASLIDRAPFLAGSRDAVILQEPRTGVVSGNAAAETLLGFGRDDWASLRIADLIVDDPGLPLPDGPYAPEDGQWQGLLWIRARNSAMLPFQAWATPCRLDDGTFVAILLRPVGAGAAARLFPAQSATPDTRHPALPRRRGAAGEGRERMPRKTRSSTPVSGGDLRASEARFRGAFEASSIGMAFIGVDGDFLQVNPALCTILGYDEEELLGKTFMDITHPDDIEADLTLVRQLLDNEISTYQIEKLYIRKQGEIICGRLTASLVRTAEGEPLYFVSQIQDVTPFKAAGAALREAEARYRMLVEQTPAAVYVDSAEGLGQALYVSPRIEALLGLTSEEWTSSPEFWTLSVHPDDQPRVMEAVQRSNQTGGPFYCEYRLIAKGGKVVWVHDEAALVFDEDGVKQCWQGLMVDITDRKLAEEQLRAAKEAAEEASRLKSAFLSMATHELRTPLTIISGYVELLAESARAHLSDDEREYVEVAQAGAKTLGALIDDLLDLARIEAGRLDLTIRPVSVEEGLERVRRMVAAQAASKGLALEVQVSPGLPLIAADMTRLLQVFINLLGNAIKFTEQGSVVARARAVGGGVEVQVSDTGIGISAAAISRIFDEFRQADSGTTRRYGGSGLGLAIAKRLVDMHGGVISVESNVGVGSTFTVWFPAADETLLTADEQEQPVGMASR